MNQTDPRVLKAIELLKEADLMGLISIGCPKDEYSPEARSIVSKFHRVASESEMKEFIVSIFGKMFNLKEQQVNNIRKHPNIDFVSQSLYKELSK